MKEYDIKDYQKQQEIVQTKIEYAYGILMEKGDRLIDDDYEEGVSYYKKANKLFTEAKELSLALLSNRYPNFIQWMKKDLYINFKKKISVTYIGLQPLWQDQYNLVEGKPL